MTKKTGWQLRY